MRNFVYLTLGLLIFTGCKNAAEQETTEVETVVEAPKMAYQSFGATITDEGVVSKEQMMAHYNNLQIGDTIDVKFTSEVKSVCQAKGCWMRLDMGENESFVKFKDYGFFMPKDIAGQEVIVEGRAFVEETSVEDLKHFAMDAGKPQEEIDAITEPELTYSFVSSGVLIPEKQ